MGILDEEIIAILECVEDGGLARGESLSALRELIEAESERYADEKVREFVESFYGNSTVFNRIMKFKVQDLYDHLGRFLNQSTEPMQGNTKSMQNTESEEVINLKDE